MQKISAQAILAESWTRTLAIGHRGAADEAPENRLVAFEAGIESGARAIECDVHLSADGEIVVIHDATLERTTSLKGRVDATSWPALKEAGVPSLVDVARVAKDRCVLVVEIKAGEEIEARVVELLRGEGMIAQSIVFSFDGRRIPKIKALAPELVVVRLLTITETLRGPKTAIRRAAGADGIGVDYHRATSRVVEAAHRQGLPVFAWTVPPGPEVDRLKAMGVNFVITNNPRKVGAQLEESESAPQPE